MNDMYKSLKNACISCRNVLYFTIVPLIRLTHARMALTLTKKRQRISEDEVCCRLTLIMEANNYNKGYKELWSWYLWWQLTLICEM